MDGDALAQMLGTKQREMEGEEGRAVVWWVEVWTAQTKEYSETGMKNEMFFICVFQLSSKCRLILTSAQKRSGIIFSPSLTNQ